jgi:hypothetical protein
MPRADVANSPDQVRRSVIHLINKAERWAKEVLWQGCGISNQPLTPKHPAM